AEVLEGRSGAVEQLQHREAPGIPERLQRRREIEGVGRDGRELGRQGVIGREGTDQRAAELGQRRRREVRELRPLAGNVQSAIGRQARQQRLAEADFRRPAAGAVELHELLTTWAPPDCTDTIHLSVSMPCFEKASSIAARTAPASCSRHSANSVGPAPEIEQPSAPADSAAERTCWKPGISTWRCFSMMTSSSEARIRSRSLV